MLPPQIIMRQASPPLLERQRLRQEALALINECRGRAVLICWGKVAQTWLELLKRTSSRRVNRRINHRWTAVWEGLAVQLLMLGQALADPQDSAAPPIHKIVSEPNPLRNNSKNQKKKLLEACLNAISASIPPANQWWHNAATCTAGNVSTSGCNSHGKH